MAYTPRPIDVSSIELSEDLQALTEKLAENAHDRWAETRIAQGWRLGAQRNDAQKLHPCLVSYEELSNEDKELDRVTAIGTLKAILALGYRITPPG